MTFRESEFPNVITQVEGIARDYPPAAVAWFVQEMIRIYRAIPLYPGLVCVCMGKAFEKRAPADPPPARGSLLVVRLKGAGVVAGRLATWSKSVVAIDAPDPFGKVRRVRVPQRNIRLVERFRADTLESFWPTLVFGRKKS